MAKERDWKREARLRKENTRQFAFRIEKLMGEDLVRCLSEKKIPLSKWFKDAVEQTLTAWDEELRLDVSNRLAVIEDLDKPEQLDSDERCADERPDETQQLDIKYYDKDESLQLRVELGLPKSSRRTFERAVRSGKLVSTKKRGKKNLYSHDCVVAWDGKS